MKKQRRVVGDIVAIELSNNRIAYGIVLQEPIFGFFDLISSGETKLLLEEIAHRPILFRIGVQRYAITKGIWKVVGHVTPPPALLEPPKFFIQSPMNGALFITKDGSDRQSATYEECINLECCAAWDPEHVVSRLEDHFAGRPNKWVELVRPTRVIT